MRRRTLLFPLAGLLAAGLLAAVVAIVAVGTGITNPPLGCSPSAGAGFAAARQALPGRPLDSGQIANAWIIYSVGTGIGLAPRAEIVAIATAMQESSLENLPFGTGDAVGLFQQRPSQSWGTVAQIMNPVHAARAFYQRLEQVGDWQSLPVTVAAQDVQHGTTPRCVRPVAGQATRLAALFSGGTGACAVDGAECRAARPSRQPAAELSAFPAGTPVAVLLAIRFAIAQLGTAYDFGGSCTNAHSATWPCTAIAPRSCSRRTLPAVYRCPARRFLRWTSAPPSIRPARCTRVTCYSSSAPTARRAAPAMSACTSATAWWCRRPRPARNVQLTPLSQWASIIVAMRRIA